VEAKVAFYKGKGRWHNRFIRYWTKSKYSHAELIIDEECYTIEPFSLDGVRKTECNYNEADWDFISFEISEEQKEIFNKFFNKTKGQGYDWVGMLVSQALPNYFVKCVNKWYCSEWIIYALRLTNIIGPVYELSDLSPNKLHQLLTEEKNNAI
tara:strand:- start:178 stop:636 length:459 start_codon:yes stop_codon:yes gene_type:complete